MTKRGFLGAALAVVLFGCATIHYDAATIEGVVAMNRVAPPDSYTRVGSFEVDTRPIFAVANLITLVDANLEDRVRRELARTGGDAVINLRMHEEFDIIDFAITFVAGNLIGSRSVTLMGDVVRWNAPGGPDLEELGAAGIACRELTVPTPGAGRTGHLCVAVD